MFAAENAKSCRLIRAGSALKVETDKHFHGFNHGSVSYFCISNVFQHQSNVLVKFPTAKLPIFGVEFCSVG